MADRKHTGWKRLKWWQQRMLDHQGVLDELLARPWLCDSSIEKACKDFPGLDSRNPKHRLALLAIFASSYFPVNALLPNNEESNIGMTNFAGTSAD
jgi:hypothetical protein